MRKLESTKESMTANSQKTNLKQIQSTFLELFGLSPALELGGVAGIGLLIVFAVFWFFHSAPPNTLTLTSGPADSIFRKNAEKYRDILKRNGVRLLILPSEGSMENIGRLADPSFHVDVGLVQGGVSRGMNIGRLVSLGSVYHEPLMVFYRDAKPVEILSQFAGKRLSIGPEGSGTRNLALNLLAANGIETGGRTPLEDSDADDAAKALLAGKVDAVFMMGDSSRLETVRKLLLTPGIRIFNFAQADAYVHRFNYLNKMEMPEGAIDLGKNIPAREVNLIGPAVELVARADLHPALSDLLLEAAREVHGNAGLFKRQGEFPSPQEHEYRLSPYASRFYKSGKTFFYRFLPFWLASWVDRILVVFVPLLVVLIPGFKIIPALYRWRINLGIYRWYRALLALEKDILTDLGQQNLDALLKRLDHIEKAVNKMTVPAPFAGQFYELRGHINFVRDQLAARAS